MQRPQLLILCVISVVVFSGCSLFGGDSGNTEIDGDGNVVQEKNSSDEVPAKELLEEGMDDYRVGKYFTAVNSFEEILNRYPFSPEAPLAELKAADCYFHMDKFDEARSLYEAFENAHPTNESIPYVMFQKGMCSYRQIDRIDRDPSGAEQAVASFRQLLGAFPESTYSPAAREKMAIAREFLARHEFFVVRFYLRTEKYRQAAARLKYMIAAYPEAEITTKKAVPLLDQLNRGEKPNRGFFSFLPNIFDEEDYLPEEGAADAPIDAELRGETL